MTTAKNDAVLHLTVYPTEENLEADRIVNRNGSAGPYLGDDLFAIAMMHPVSSFLCEIGMRPIGLNNYNLSARGRPFIVMAFYGKISDDDLMLARFKGQVKVVDNDEKDYSFYVTLYDKWRAAPLRKVDRPFPLF